MSEQLGPNVEMFTSLEEMVEMMDQRTQAANDAALPEQVAITYGDHVIKFDANSGLAIFGEITPWDLLVEDSYDDDASDEERQAVIADLESSYERGYRQGRWYSTVLPEGELGSSHIASCWKIPKGFFDKARGDNWLIHEDDFYALQRESDEAAIRAGKMTREELDALELQARTIAACAEAWIEAGKTPEAMHILVYVAMKVMFVRDEDAKMVVLAIQETAEVFEERKNL
jgi:hypothetical protein